MAGSFSHEMHFLKGTGMSNLLQLAVFCFEQVYRCMCNEQHYVQAGRNTKCFSQKHSALNIVACISVLVTQAKWSYEYIFTPLFKGIFKSVFSSFASRKSCRYCTCFCVRQSILLLSENFEPQINTHAVIVCEIKTSLGMAPASLQGPEGD